MNDFFIVFIIGIGLMFDTFAVSVSIGVQEKNIKFKEALKISSIFAVFQGGLPFAGWLAGKQFSKIISDYDHWVAFTILCIIGLKMIIEAIKNDNESINIKNFFKIIILSLATSIDAFSIGFSFALLSFGIILACIIFGLQTGFTGMLGMLIGKKVGTKLGRRSEILGGLILIGLGFKILFEHI